MKKKNKHKQNSLIKSFKIISKSVREYKKPSLITPLFIAGEVVMEVTIPFIMAIMIDEMYGDVINPIYVYGTIMILMALMSLTFGFLAGKSAATASTGFAKNLRKDLFNKVQDFSFAEIDKFSTSSLITRLTTDVTNVQNAYQMLIRVAVRAPLMGTFAFIMTFTVSWKLALIYVAVIPVLALGLILIMKNVIPIFKRIFKKYDKLNNTVQENIAAIRVVKSFVREEHEKKNFKIIAEDVKDDFTKVEKTIALSNPLMMFSIYISMLLIAYFGSRLIILSGGTELTAGGLTSLVTYTMYILMTVMMISMIFVMLTMSLESVNRIVEVLETDSTLPQNETGSKDIPDASIEFRNVCFKYSKEADKFAIENINLKIASGETIGILGGTGSSKSTLVQLIPRLYDVTEGEVLVGGKNVKAYNLKALRDEVSIVLQKNVLFSGTIKENLRWGNPNATDEEMIEACKMASADEFIQQLPDKYDTFIERGGTNVSGGQKQRLCIARSILKKPKILIFDDSTSAVDTKTDSKIRASLIEKIPNTTIIIIAQRIHSVEKADHIVLMDNGRILAMGSHEELMANSEEYRETYDSQTKSKGGN